MRGIEFGSSSSANNSVLKDVTYILLIMIMKTLAEILRECSGIGEKKGSFFLRGILAFFLVLNAL
jgi:hypothetical protein